MPSEYYVQQGWHLLKSNYWIKDAKDEKDVFEVRGTNFTWGMQVTLHDMNGKELAAIKQTKVVTFYPKYEVFRDGKIWAKCTKENFIGFGKKEASLAIPGNNNYKIMGDNVAGRFEIFRTETENKCAEVVKGLGVRDRYKVKIEDGEDEVALLVIFVLIDGIYHADDSSEGAFIARMITPGLSKIINKNKDKKKKEFKGEYSQDVCA